MGRLAWPLCGLTVMVLAVTGAVGGIATAEDLPMTLALVVIAALGALMASRVPRNPIGWIFLGVGVFTAATAGLAVGLLRAGGREDPAAWIEHWTWIPLVALPTTFVLLLFPDGRLPSPRWRVLVWVSAVGVAGFTLSTAFGPYLGGVSAYGANPYHLPALSAAVEWTAVPMILAVLGSVAAVIVRFRHAVGAERQQIKWLAYGSATAVATLILVSALYSLVPFAVAYSLVPFAVADAIIVSAIMLIPIAVAVAIVRYRLYDIDRIVSRTVSYVSLSGVLIGTYVGSVLLMLPVLGAGSDVSIAAATLVAAAVFQPARRRIQGVVDRRFNRRRYDAAQTVEDFSMRVRHDVDLASVASELVAAASTTMEPVRIALWLREPA